MNRLTSSVATGSATHNLTFSYDIFGNMTCVTNAQTQGFCPSYTFNAATNRMANAGYAYDAAGDLTADGTGTGTHTYQFDAEKRLISVDSGTTASYTYNALGQRAEKKVGTVYTEYVQNAAGEPIAEHNRTTWAQQVVSLGGRHLAHYQNNATCFTHVNKVGSTTQVTDDTGAVAQDQIFYPWGQDWAMAGTSQETRFASLQHRDTATGLDPTPFRMYMSRFGRWLSPDPIGKKAVRLTDPQTWNMYAHVRNNPTTLTDPSGLLVQCSSDLGKRDGARCQQIIDTANRKDKKGNYVNPKLHAIYQRLNDDKRTFTIEKAKLGGNAGGLFTIRQPKSAGTDFGSAAHPRRALGPRASLSPSLGGRLGFRGS